MADVMPETHEDRPQSESERMSLIHDIIGLVDRLSVDRIGPNYLFGREALPEVINYTAPAWRTYARDLEVEVSGVDYSVQLGITRTDGANNDRGGELFKPNNQDAAFRVLVRAIPLVLYERPEWVFAVMSHNSNRERGPWLVVRQGHPQEDIQPVLDDRYEYDLLCGLEDELNRLEDLAISVIDPSSARRRELPSGDSGQ